MPAAIERRSPIALIFEDDGRIPNNPTLPLIIYPGAIALGGSSDPAHRIEKIFAQNGWGDMWRDGIFPYVHYHSMIHEALSVARGRATVRFGGEYGEKIKIGPGDVVILPAGTGHQCITQTRDLTIVGAYPPSGKYNLCRANHAEHAKALATIPKVPLPATDPVFGPKGPLLRLWRP
jgi:uncharacterized protein YjlB